MVYKSYNIRRLIGAVAGGLYNYSNAKDYKTSTNT